MTVLDGQIYSGWVEAMWPTTKTKGLAPKGVVLNTLEGVSQVILSEVITSLYTGEIETDGSKLESQFMTADYLQIQTVVDTLMHYISTDFELEDTDFMSHLLQKFDLIRTTDGKSIIDCINAQFLSKLSYSLKRQDELDSVYIDELITTHLNKWLISAPRAQTVSVLQGLLRISLCPSQVIAALLIWMTPTAKEGEDCTAMLGDAFFQAIENHITKEESGVLLQTLSNLESAFTSRANTAPLLLRLYSILVHALKKDDQKSPYQVWSPEVRLYKSNSEDCLEIMDRQCCKVAVPIAIGCDGRNRSISEEASLSKVTVKVKISAMIKEGASSGGYR